MSWAARLTLVTSGQAGNDAGGQQRADREQRGLLYTTELARDRIARCIHRLTRSPDATAGPPGHDHALTPTSTNS
jgi:hypothetical protein